MIRYVGRSYGCSCRGTVSGDMLRAIRAMYQAIEACVRIDGEVRQGVRQGFPMSSWLYIQHLSRYGGQEVYYVRQFSGRSDIECMQGAGTVRE